MTRGTVLVVVLGMVCALGRGGDARACGIYSVLETTTLVHPDQPLARFAAGDLGVLQPTYARSYLVVAHRWLAGRRLSAREQEEAVALWHHRLGGTWPDPEHETHPLQRWLAVRRRVAAPIVSMPTMGNHQVGYVYRTRCLPDAFTIAARVLDEKLATRGPRDGSVLKWAQAQDRVFTVCGNPGLPPPVAAGGGASDEDRRDRSYQIASALFYAERYPEAIAALEDIAADTGSPHAPLAAYLVARAEQRRGDLPAAERACRRVLRDRRFESMHRAATAYLGYLRFRTAPEARRRELDRLLVHEAHPLAFGSAVGDYTLLIDAVPDHAEDWRFDPSVRPVLAPAREPLRRWLQVVQGRSPRPFDDAHAGWIAGRTVPWLVAALMRADDPTDARVPALIAAGRAIPRAHPGRLTALWHAARLQIARGELDAPMTADVAAAHARISPEMPSARAHYGALVVLTARDADEWLRGALATPAGWRSSDGTWVSSLRREPPSDPDEEEPEDAETVEARRPRLHPAAAIVLDRGLPLSVWARLATRPGLDAPARRRLVLAAYTRAHVLGDRRTAARLAARARALLAAEPTPEPYSGRPDPRALVASIDAVEAAPSGPAQTRALLELIMTHPEASPAGGHRETWGRGWCATPTRLPQALDPAPARLLTAAERDAVAREQRQLDRLGRSGGTYVARTAARIAPQLRGEPQMAQTLARAVWYTRTACADTDTREASRRAFRALHDLFPDSTEAAQVRYYYAGRGY